MRSRSQSLSQLLSVLVTEPGWFIAAGQWMLTVTFKQGKPFMSLL